VISLAVAAPPDGRDQRELYFPADAAAAHARLPPRPAGLPPWDHLSDTDKKVGARWMEIFCRALEHTDHQAREAEST
jgi:hypothetical protein